MAYTKSADGVAKKGKTSVQVFPNSGSNQKETMGGKKSSGVKNGAALKVGRNLARVANQRGG
jgi:hypothetical protein